MRLSLLGYNTIGVCSGVCSATRSFHRVQSPFLLTHSRQCAHDDKGQEGGSRSWYAPRASNDAASVQSTGILGDTKMRKNGDQDHHNTHAHTHTQCCTEGKGEEATW